MTFLARWIAWLGFALTAMAGETKLSPPIATSSAGFGFSVAIESDLLVVSAPEGINPVAPGSVHLWRGPQVWVHEQVISAADSFVGNAFGFSVATDGVRVLVGAPESTGPLASAGAAYLFEFNAGNWSQVAKLVASDGADFDQFGHALSISAERLAISAPFHDAGAAPDTGAVYIFERQAGTWVEVDKLEAPDALAFDSFGWSLGGGVDRLAIGAPGVDDFGGLSGSLYVFDRVSGVWGFTQELHASNASPLDRFGKALALDGDRMLVGAPSFQASGAAYLFGLVGGTWQELAPIDIATTAVGDNFGGSLALEGPLAVVGAHSVDRASADVGRVYLFHVDTGVAAVVTQLSSSDGGFGDSFGWSVAATLDTLVVGAPQHDLPALDVGATYVWDLDLPEVGSTFCDGSAACPCSNIGAPGAGCTNSTALGARLLALGSRRVSSDDLHLRCEALPVGESALLFVGLNQVQAGAGAFFGDGLRCVGGGVVRLGVIASGANGSATWGPGLGSAGGWQPGDVRRFQVWYRDTVGGACGSGFNTSIAVEMEFLP